MIFWSLLFYRQKYYWCPQNTKSFLLFYQICYFSNIAKAILDLSLLLIAFPIEVIVLTTLLKFSIGFVHWFLFLLLLLVYIHSCRSFSHLKAIANSKVKLIAIAYEWKNKERERERKKQGEKLRETKRVTWRVTWHDMT